MLVSQRLLCSTALPHVYGETTVIVESGGYEFSTKGRSIVQMGWKGFEERFRASIQAKTSKAAEEKMITAEKGQCWWIDCFFFTADILYNGILSITSDSDFFCLVCIKNLIH